MDSRGIREVALDVVGITDPGAAGRVERALRDNRGVVDAHVDPSTGRARVRLTRDAVLEHLLESAEQAGFMARPSQDGD